VLAGLFGVRMRREPWAAPFIAVLATIAGWYMVEPVYFADFFYEFTPSASSSAFACVFIFLVSFVIACPFVVKAFEPKARQGTGDMTLIHPEQFIPTIVAVWLVLLVFGIYRLDGDVFGALFPIEGRSGLNMWQRGAGEDAGAYGSLVSAATYVYILVLGLFGLLLPFTKKPALRILLVACIVVSWPYAFLQGSRNITLAVVIPALAAYLLIGRRRPAVKFFIAIVAFFGLDFAMRTIIQFRNVGFDLASLTEVEHAQHLGLNMASELIWIVGFVDDRAIEISYGMGYLKELLNVVPRAIWPDKPLLGIEYAIARGFGGGQADIGVFATLSTGVVGQGVLNFGTWFGPFVAALLMACWVGILTRLREQGGVARIRALPHRPGLTFNLGRDVTLLVLFPFVFGYIGVRILEARQERREVQARVQHRAATVGLRRIPAAGKAPF
jgi:hypothetical protein